MNDGFVIEGGTLKKYRGERTDVSIPDNITKIGVSAFSNCKGLISVSIPDGVKEIGAYAFEGCAALASIKIPPSVSEIGMNAFDGCAALASVTLCGNAAKIGYKAFRNCRNLDSFVIGGTGVTFDKEVFIGCDKLMDGNGFLILGDLLFSYTGEGPDAVIPSRVTRIGDRAFFNNRKLVSVSIPDGVTSIGRQAFCGCEGLADENGFVIVRGVLYSYHGHGGSIVIPEGVTSIDNSVFSKRADIVSVTMPESLRSIGERAFEKCSGLTSAVIPESGTNIESMAFWQCSSLASVIIPDSAAEISDYAFSECPSMTAVCSEGSYAHRYCEKNRISYIFDYQYEAFHGVIPPGIERIAAPFLADEETPYIFISYSHKDRDRILPVIKTLYEFGWKIWYDEGLTIGDRYDDTLETHVKNCSAFLLFVTENSLNSMYVKENEIPWAIECGKPIVKCILDRGTDYEIEEKYVSATVSPDGIPEALERIDGLEKGEIRTAKGISVIVNPAEREWNEGSGFACSLYTGRNSPGAQAVLLEARNGGCIIRDAAATGSDRDDLRNCACLIVFLDRDFLSDENLTKTLIEEFESGRDIAVCSLEDLEDDDLPPDLTALHKMQWLNFAHGINGDLTTKLIRHLQKRGCRNAAVLPGFEYDRTDRGIVIRKYTGTGADIAIEGEYGGTPVIEIADNTFKNCVRLRSVTIRGGVERIGNWAFLGCSGLRSVTLPDSLLEIGASTFENCPALTEIRIPGRVRKIGANAFRDCAGLLSAAIPDSVTQLDGWAFQNCTALRTVSLPRGMTSIGRSTFENCKNLVSVSVPDSISTIGFMAFSECVKLESLSLPESVDKIDFMAFSGCKNLKTVSLPDSLSSIDDKAFEGCGELTVECSAGSYSEKYCAGKGIKTITRSKEQPEPRKGFFGRLFKKNG
ncbi:MAG: leucine-rich repeat protein [Oscillospiraceae bacterium]|nr:leucine-rich repeat protein [Oscillospiraceae bacterium]